MTFNKKKVFVVALSVCLIAILSMGSLAWFSASDSVKNDFFIADSEDDTADEIFSVDVWEYTEDSPNEKVPSGDTYENVLPGDVLKKEPHVANTGHYAQYIRVIVEISDADVWQAALGTKFDTYAVADWFDGYDASQWTDVTAAVVGGNIQIVMYYDGTLASGSDITVFTAVKVPSELTQAQAANMSGGFTVNVKAQAVQTENVGATAKEAFDTVNLAI